MLHDPLSYFSELLPARVWSLCIGGRAEFWPVLPAQLGPCLGPLLFSEFWSVLREGMMRHFSKNQCKSDLIWFWQNWDKTLSNKHRSHIRKIAWLRNRINSISMLNVSQKQGIIKLNAAKISAQQQLYDCVTRPTCKLSIPHFHWISPSSIRTS